MKQSKLRKRRVWRFAVLYFAMLILFLALIIGPIVAGKFLTNIAKSIPMDLYQPSGQDNNDTGGPATGTRSAAAAAATSAAARLVKLL